MTDMPKMIDLLNLGGAVAVVTGGGSGIGRASALRLAEAEATVVVTDVDGETAAAVAQEIIAHGGTAESAVLDVVDAAAVTRVMDDIMARHHRLDVLINNAGIAAREATERMSLEIWNRVTAVNMTGAFWCAREAGRHMVRQNSGQIVNIASIMGMVGGGLYPNAAYHASKGALVNLTRALAVEWDARNVRVNAVEPTYVVTPLTDHLRADTEMTNRIIERTPMRRFAEADEVARAVLYLSTDASAMVTGHILAVDGGWLAQ